MKGNKINMSVDHKTPAQIMHDKSITWWQRAIYFRRYREDYPKYTVRRIALKMDLTINEVYLYGQLEREIDRRPLLRSVSNKREAVRIMRADNTNSELRNYIKKQRRKLGLDEISVEFETLEC